MSLYQQLATEIEQQIDAGAFPPGSKLPSVRGFATTRGISPTTVAGKVSVSVCTGNTK